MKTKSFTLSRMKFFHFILTLLLLLPALAGAQHSRRNATDKNPYRANYQRVYAGRHHTLEIRGGTLWA